MKNKKVIGISIAIVIIIATAIIVTKLTSQSTKISNKNEIEEKIENNKSLDIAEIKENVEDNKIFYIHGEGMFIYEPTIENLYKNSDIVMVGTFSENVKTYVPGISIHTKVKFNKKEVLKNTSNIEIKEDVTFDMLGGAVTLSEYMKDNPTIKDGEFENIPTKERGSYYVVQEYAPNNKLSLASNSTDEYVLFLSVRDGELYANTSHYGVRKIEQDKIYDYDTNQYISNKLIKK